ncbi:MAG: hypothetical protein ABH914_01710 [Candidatus Omnitrophota bacterium]
MKNRGYRGFLSVVFLLFFLVCPFLSSSAFSQDAVEGESGDVKADNEMEYNAGDLRDPLRPQFFLQKKKETKIEEEPYMEKRKASELFALSIQGIIWNSDTPLAVINNKVIKKGEVILLPSTEKDISAEVRIMDIDEDGITIIYSGDVEKLPSPKNLELSNKEAK